MSHVFTVFIVFIIFHALSCSQASRSLRCVILTYLIIPGIYITISNQSLHVIYLEGSRSCYETPPGFVWIGFIAVEPYRGDLKDHASRVLRLYLTLAIARLAPILTRIASYWEAYRTVIEPLGVDHSWLQTLDRKGSASLRDVFDSHKRRGLLWQWKIMENPWKSELWMEK